MRRRTLLKACGVSALGTAGCVSTPQSEPLFGVTSSLEMTISPVGASASESLGRVTGEVIAEPTRDSPLVIELVLENATSNSIAFSGNIASFPFTAGSATGAPPGLSLMYGPTPDSDESSSPEAWDHLPAEKPVEGCWRPPDPGHPLTWVIPDGGINIPLEPDGALARRYAVLYRPDSEATERSEIPDECYPAGSHEFVDQILLDGIQHEWAVTLTIEN